MFVVGVCGLLLDQNGVPYGVKGVGKDEVAKVIQQHYSNVHIYSHATPLKESLAKAYDLDLVVVDTPEEKEKPIEKLGGVSWRFLLEKFGTDVARVGVSKALQALGFPMTDDIWIRKMKTRIMNTAKTRLETLVQSTYDVSDEDTFSEQVIPRLHCTFRQLCETTALTMSDVGLPPLPAHDPTEKIVIVIPDVRFPNEYEAIKDLGGYTFRVSRVVPRDLTIISDDHSSNHVHPNMHDVAIDNNGSLDDLKEKVLQSLEIFLPH